ncbi:MAG TPA: FdtA/QdtA family cupin domain-containing protein [Salinivirgaceae bacterium]|nr:FdtA/QdtA family cupin domain-containing protein [Salinivirgaceae bacterium]HQA76498.1 FdtA/QdtA family cupin domain-containing protein [Salinivirgaceae bacterium]
MNKPTIIQLPKILDKRGNLSFFEYPKQLPFEIARTYWIYDVPGGEIRGSHAFKEQQEFIIALSGSFDVVLHNGKKEQKFSLNRSYYGLYVPKMYWRRLENFSTNSLALIVSDKHFNANDYIRNFEEFKRLRYE